MLGPKTEVDPYRTSSPGQWSKRKLRAGVGVFSLSKNVVDRSLHVRQRCPALIKVRAVFDLLFGTFCTTARCCCSAWTGILPSSNISHAALDFWLLFWGQSTRGQGPWCTRSLTLALTFNRSSGRNSSSPSRSSASAKYVAVPLQRRLDSSPKNSTSSTPREKGCKSTKKKHTMQAQLSTAREASSLSSCC